MNRIISLSYWQARREQSFVILVLGILAALILLMAFASGDRSIGTGFFIVSTVISLFIVVSGAMMISHEREIGTLDRVRLDLRHPKSFLLGRLAWTLTGIVVLAACLFGPWYALTMFNAAESNLVDYKMTSGTVVSWLEMLAWSLFFSATSRSVIRTCVYAALAAILAVTVVVLLQRMVQPQATDLFNAVNIGRCLVAILVFLVALRRAVKHLSIGSSWEVPSVVATTQEVVGTSRVEAWGASFARFAHRWGFKSRWVSALVWQEFMSQRWRWGAVFAISLAFLALALLGHQMFRVHSTLYLATVPCLLFVAIALGGTTHRYEMDQGGFWLAAQQGIPASSFLLTRFVSAWFGWFLFVVVWCFVTMTVTQTNRLETFDYLPAHGRVTLVSSWETTLALASIATLLFAIAQVHSFLVESRLVHWVMIVMGLCLPYWVLLSILFPEVIVLRASYAWVTAQVLVAVLFTTVLGGWMARIYRPTQTGAWRKWWPRIVLYSISPLLFVSVWNGSRATDPSIGQDTEFDWPTDQYASAESLYADGESQFFALRTDTAKIAEEAEWPLKGYRDSFELGLDPEHPETDDVVELADVYVRFIDAGEAAKNSPLVAGGWAPFISESLRINQEMGEATAMPLALVFEAEVQGLGQAAEQWQFERALMSYGRFCLRMGDYRLRDRIAEVVRSRVWSWCIQPERTHDDLMVAEEFLKEIKPSPDAGQYRTYLRSHYWLPIVEVASLHRNYPTWYPGRPSLEQTRKKIAACYDADYIRLQAGLAELTQNKLPEYSPWTNRKQYFTRRQLETYYPLVLQYARQLADHRALATRVLARRVSLELGTPITSQKQLRDHVGEAALPRDPYTGDPFYWIESDSVAKRASADEQPVPMSFDFDGLPTQRSLWSPGPEVEVDAYFVDVMNTDGSRFILSRQDGEKLTILRESFMMRHDPLGKRLVCEEVLSLGSIWSLESAATRLAAP